MDTVGRNDSETYPQPTARRYHGRPAVFKKYLDLFDPDKKSKLDKKPEE